MTWYYALGSEQKGPVSDEDLDSLHRKGEISDETLIWMQGMDNWKAYGSVRGSVSPDQGISSGTDLVTCAISGRKVPANMAIPIEGVWVSAEFKEQALQRIREGLPLSNAMRYAGFWIRFLAIFIDGVVTGVGSMVVMFFFGMVLALSGMAAETVQIVITIINLIVSFSIGAAYEIIMVGKKGATLGKMACGLKITDEEGKPIGYGRSTGRYFAKILSALILYIGYIMVAFDDQKRGLHDRICETRVTYK